MTSKPVYFENPPEVCNLCSRPFGAVMFDAKTKLGPWGNLCDPCFDEYGVRLGAGFGQKFELQEDGRWLKTV